LGGLRGQLVFQPQLLRLLGYWKDSYYEIYRNQGIDSERLSLLTYDSADVSRLNIGQLLPIVADIPEKVIKEISLTGTPEEIAQKLDNFIQSGVNHFCFEIINGVSQ
ncbi:MAG: hypothetical protein ACFFDP_02485, partial [Promethearchaeota archaeon]